MDSEEDIASQIGFATQYRPSPTPKNQRKPTLVAEIAGKENTENNAIPIPRTSHGLASELSLKRQPLQSIGPETNAGEIPVNSRKMEEGESEQSQDNHPSILELMEAEQHYAYSKYRQPKAQSAEHERQGYSHELKAALKQQTPESRRIQSSRETDVLTRPGSRSHLGNEISCGTDPAPLKRRLNSQQVSEEHVSKKARFQDPDTPLPGVSEDSGMSFDEITNRDLRNKTKHLNSMLESESIESCYNALVAVGGDREKAKRYLEYGNMNPLTGDDDTDGIDLYQSGRREPLRPVDTESCSPNYSKANGRDLHVKFQGEIRQDAPAAKNFAPIHHEARLSNTVTEAQHPVSGTRLGRWRSEALHGRYVPRHVTNIGRTQTELLEASHSWQPPLIGNSFCEGQLPLDIYDQLTRVIDGHQTDAGAVLPEPEAGQVPVLNRAITPVEGNDESNAPNRPQSSSASCSAPEVSMSQWPLSPTQGPDQNSIISSSQLSIVSPSQWSVSQPTPRSRRRTLPPDSPSAHRIFELTKPVRCSPKYRDTGENDSRKSSLYETNAFEETPNKAERDMDDQFQAAQGDSGFGKPLELLQSPPACTEEILDEQMQPSSTYDKTRNTTASQGSVEVNSTPYLPGNASKSPTLVISRTLNNSPTCVPGTFNDLLAPDGANDESPGERRSKLLNVVNSQRKTGLEVESTAQSTELLDQQNKSITDHLDGFGSSENHIELFGDGPDKEAEELRSVGHEQLNLLGEHERSPICSSHKQRTESAFSLSPARRSMSMSPPITDDRQKHDCKLYHSGRPDLGYAPVQEQLRNQRREFFLTEKVRRTEPASSSEVKGSTGGLKKVHSHSEEFEGSSETTFTREKHHSSTPLTEVSFQQQTSRSTKRDQLRQLAEKSQLTQSIHELYASFNASYPTYEGDVLQFETACSLLRDLKKAGRAPHPSLWDDFIIRLHHEYQDYVRQLQQTCGSILPFERYYEESVESPRVLSRVVRPDSIVSLARTEQKQSPFTSPVVRADSSARETSVTRRRIRLDRSVSPSKPVIKLHSSSMLPEASTAMEGHKDSQQYVGQADPAYSQDSSVKLWLEEAAGAESPILGTPGPAKNLTDIPAIDLDELSNVLDTSLRDQRRANREQQHSPLNQDGEQLNWQPAIPKERVPAGEKPDKPVLLDAIPLKCGTSNPTMKTESATKTFPTATSKTKVLRSEDIANPRKSFESFVKSYSNLPGEKAHMGSFENADVQRIRNIFSWRQP